MLGLKLPITTTNASEICLGTCGVNTVSCADYRVNCETEFAKTATMIWPEPDHVEDFAAWKKAGDAAVADEKKYYEGKGGGGDSEPSGVSIFPKFSLHFGIILRYLALFATLLESQL